MLVLLAPAVQATHIRAGQITATSDSTANPNPLRYFFKLTLYTDSSPGKADQPDATLYFGDGTSQKVNRSAFVALGNNIWYNTYYFDHIYPSPSPNYTVTFNGENRNDDILNMNNSNQQTFFIQTRITIDPFLGINRSPVLLRSPVDVGTIGQIFTHNPDAYDADGDSLSFILKVPQTSIPGQLPPVGQPVPGYRNPDNPFFGGTAVPNPPGGPVTFTLDQQTGQITWNAPNMQGEYNIAFVVEEWRGRRKLGEVTRDMQILIRATTNRRPVLQMPQEICIEAGTLLQQIISASDPDVPNPTAGQLTLSASSGIIPPAVFTNLSASQGQFTWTPACTDIRSQPYQVIFKAEDNPNAPEPKLVDVQTWRITVVGPAPQNLTATPQSRNIQLNWDLYTCQNASKIMIYRKEGPSGFVPGNCVTGVPAGTGYQKIDEVAANVNSYLDTNDGAGLRRGVSYCYLIYAEFPLPAGGKSYASQEICANLDTNVPVMLNVSVTETSETTGKMFVRWTKPANLAAYTQPIAYRLLRADGLVGTGGFTEVFNSTVPTDTVFNDNNLNTRENNYRYKIEFYENATGAIPRLIETTETASNVKLQVTPSATALNLNWTYEVPWDNSRLKHYIYREINSNFILIDSVDAGLTSGSYTDQGTFNNEPLQPRKQYCYYVTTNGTYNNTALPDSLLNNSQQVCVI
ncbi:MAG TPA: hypothetical protein VK927_05895, partial [Adhaeribacter sp.]|nr:hypothetical protein [Adhaeribacter sp.]